MPSEIAEATEHLLTEALQQSEELARGVPSARDAGGGNRHAALAQLRELSPEELDLLQLCTTTGWWQAVLDRAAGSDLEVAQQAAVAAGARLPATVSDRAAPRRSALEQEAHRGRQWPQTAPRPMQRTAIRKPVRLTLLSHGSG